MRLLFWIWGKAVLVHLLVSVVLTVVFLSTEHPISAVVTAAVFGLHLFLYRRTYGRHLWRRNVARARYWQAVQQQAADDNRRAIDQRKDLS